MRQHSWSAPTLGLEVNTAISAVWSCFQWGKARRRATVPDTSLSDVQAVVCQPLITELGSQWPTLQPSLAHPTWQTTSVACKDLPTVCFQSVHQHPGHIVALCKEPSPVSCAIGRPEHVKVLGHTDGCCVEHIEHVLLRPVWAHRETDLRHQ